MIVTIEFAKLMRCLKINLPPQILVGEAQSDRAHFVAELLVLSIEKPVLKLTIGESGAVLCKDAVKAAIQIPVSCSGVTSIMLRLISA